MDNTKARDLLGWAVASTQAFNEGRMYDHDVMPRCMRAQEALESVFCELATLHAENARLRAVVAAADRLRDEVDSIVAFEVDVPDEDGHVYDLEVSDCLEAIEDIKTIADRAGGAYDEARAALGEVK